MTSERLNLRAALERILARSSSSSSSNSSINVVASDHPPRGGITVTPTRNAVFYERLNERGLLNKPPGPPWFTTMLGPSGEAALDEGRRERSLRRAARKHK